MLRVSDNPQSVVIRESRMSYICLLVIVKIPCHLTFIVYVNFAYGVHDQHITSATVLATSYSTQSITVHIDKLTDYTVIHNYGNPYEK